VGQFTELERDAGDLADVLAEASEPERELFAPELDNLSERVGLLYRETLFTMPHPDAPAILSIKSGAGGTESQDWAAMLLRMYSRWAERRGFQLELLDTQEGQQAGITSCELIVRGERAYGLLSVERGVHRLVRTSPFDSNNRRHTSFASVEVVPELPAEQLDIEVPESDVRVDVYRSQGSGGQGVNTTDSAVRVLHIPTGIIVAIQVTRSQIKNREMAMQILKNRLYELEQRKREAEAAAARGEQKAIEWGSQIRSYVLDKQYVKDHRSGLMRYDTANVLDGDIDDLIWAGLEWRAGQRSADGADDAD
jgi:peptide chain release factor 2